MIRKLVFLLFEIKSLNFFKIYMIFPQFKIFDWIKDHEFRFEKNSKTRILKL